MTQVPSPAVLNHLVKQVTGIAEGLLKTVLEANGMAVTPTHGRELAPVPVYEDDRAVTLLTVANSRAVTVLEWVVSPNGHLQAYYMRYRDADTRRVRNRIVVLASNYCWSRFYAAKELIHCFLDDDGFGASNSIESVNSLIESLVTSGIVMSECAPETAVDELAWYGAALYLLPEAWLPTIRQLRVQMQEEFKDENVDLYLAQLLRVPELILKHRLKDRP